MSQEQRDSYVIPPNFIEGGSFFGGLFKARNVVEAVILAAGTGLPILTFSLTLTVRIILLCLTSLLLALLALIGIAGMPLSSYIILFFRFLRNRRSLSKSGGKSSRKQAILPTWDKKSGPSTAVQPAAYKKDGSRIRFAKDTRRLMLDTAYRQKKQAERPGNPLAAYVPIQKVENGIVYTTDHRFIKILEIVPINFLLRSARAQRNIVYSFISYLKIAPVKLQIKVITKRADMNRHIETVRREMEQETNESCRMQQEDYLKLLKKLGSKEAIARRFFLIMEYEPLPGAKKDREEADAISSLQTAARTAANYLSILPRAGTASPGQQHLWHPHERPDSEALRLLPVSRLRRLCTGAQGDRSADGNACRQITSTKTDAGTSDLQPALGERLHAQTGCLRMAVRPARHPGS